MYFLIENRFLIYYDEYYWKNVLKRDDPQNYFNNDIYTLTKRGTLFLHNNNGPAIIDLKTGQEMFFVNGKEAVKQDLHNAQFKSKFTSMLEDLKEKEIEVYTWDTYNGKSKWRMVLKSDEQT